MEERVFLTKHSRLFTIFLLESWCLKCFAVPDLNKNHWQPRNLEETGYFN
jgi:hypothetical protein